MRSPGGASSGRRPKRGSACPRRCPDVCRPRRRPAPRRTTSIIAEEIRREVDAAEADFQSAVQHAIRAGELLIEAKAAVGHGNFGPWLKANFPGSRRTAERYMSFFQNRHAVAHLRTVADAAEALTKPKPKFCEWAGGEQSCDLPATHRPWMSDNGWCAMALPEDGAGKVTVPGYCLGHANLMAEYNFAHRGDGYDEAFSRPLASARDARGFSIPPRDRRLNNPNVPDRPHPVGVAEDPGLWVLRCPNCGHDLTRNMRRDDEAT
jgi:hypothetical protein